MCTRNIHTHISVQFGTPHDKRFYAPMSVTTHIGIMRTIDRVGIPINNSTNSYTHNSYCCSIMKMPSRVWMPTSPGLSCFSIKVRFSIYERACCTHTNLRLCANNTLPDLLLTNINIKELSSEECICCIWREYIYSLSLHVKRKKVVYLSNLIEFNLEFN